MHRFSSLRVILIGIFCILVFPLLSLASLESQDFIRQGVDNLKEGKPKQALKKFQAAEKAGGEDAEALFFQGAALNRLGRCKDALVCLEKAKSMGSEHPEFAFEMGWSLLGTDRYEDAVREFEGFEQAHPGLGKTSEFLGRAYFYMNEDEKAEKNLKEAVIRDPNLKPTAALFLAALADKWKKPELSAAYVRTILRESPHSPLGRTLWDYFAWTNVRKQKRWHITLSTSGGYNSNVIGLGDSVLLPSDISSKDAAFFRFTFGGNYVWYPTPKDSFSAGYGFLADFYDDISSNDTLDHYFYTQYSHALNQKQGISFRVSDEYTMLGGDELRNQVSLRPAFSHRFKDWIVGEIYYGLGIDNYYFSTPDVQDRDGLGHTIGINGYFKIPKTSLLVRLGYYHLWNLANGGDFDFDSDAVSFGLSHPLIWKITGEFFYTHLFDNYDNNNSLAGGGFDFPRDDDVDMITVQLNRPVKDWLSAYVRYDYRQDDSNIPFFNFDQHIVTAGLIVAF